MVLSSVVYGRYRQSGCTHEQTSFAFFTCTFSRNIAYNAPLMCRSQSSSRRNDGSMGSVTPYPLALVVCDFIWDDPDTGKKTLIGTFSVIEGRSFPLVHPSISVLASLTDGCGAFVIRLELSDVDDEREPIFSLEHEVEVDDPRVIVEQVFVADNVVFTHPGEYRLRLFANHEFLIERRLILAASGGYKP